MLSQIFEMQQRMPASLQSNVYSPYMNNPGLSQKQHFFTAELDGAGEPVKIRCITKEDAINHYVFSTGSTNPKPGTFDLSKLIGQDQKDYIKNNSWFDFLGNGSFNAKKLNDYISHQNKAIKLLGENFDHPVMNLYQKLPQDTEELNLLIKDICEMSKEYIRNENDDEKFINQLSKTFIILENQSFTKRGTDNLVHTARAYDHLSQHLKNQEQNESNDGFVDAFGVQGARVAKKDTWPTFPIGPIGKFSLYQQDQTCKAYNNYGMVGTESFPITKKMQESLTNTFKSIVNQIDENGRKKLCNIQEINGINFLMIAVPLLDPDSNQTEFEHEPIYNQSPMSFIGSDDDETDEEESENKVSEYRFLKHGKHVIEALRGEAKKQPKAEFSIIVIMQKGNFAPCLAANYNIGLDDLANRVQLACDACEHSIKRKINAYASTRNFDINTMYGVLNKKWTRQAGLDANEKFSKHKLHYHVYFEYGNLLRMFLYGDSQTAQSAINHLGKYHSNLLINVASRISHGQRPALERDRKDVLYLPSILSFLLLLKGSSMAESKQSVAYMLGEVLGCADALHRRWYDCTKPNKKKYPQSFVGSDFIYRFRNSNNVSHVFDQFAHRVHPYDSWAKNLKTNDAQDEIKIFWRYFRNRLRQIGVKADQEGLPNRLTDEEKAKMSLGFFSVYDHVGKKQESTHETVTT